MSLFKLHKKRNLIKNIQYKIIICENKLEMSKELQIKFTKKQQKLIDRELFKISIYNKALNKIRNL